jgi:hypothetical protein
VKFQENESFYKEKLEEYNNQEPTVRLFFHAPHSSGRWTTEGDPSKHASGVYYDYEMHI